MWQVIQTIALLNTTRHGRTKTINTANRSNPIAHWADGKTLSVAGVISRNGIGIMEVADPNSTLLSAGIPI